MIKESRREFLSRLLRLGGVLVVGGTGIISSGCFAPDMSQVGQEVDTQREIGPGKERCFPVGNAGSAWQAIKEATGLDDAAVTRLSSRARCSNPPNNTYTSCSLVTSDTRVCIPGQ